MHSYTGMHSSLTGKISTNKRIRQEYTLALIFFNLHISDIPKSRHSTDMTMPKVKNKPVKILFYADDMLLMSYTQAGMRRLLSRRGSYCRSNYLDSISPKLRQLFSGRSRLSIIGAWDRDHYDQVKSCLSLGLVFTETGSWLPHFKRIYLRATAYANIITQLTSDKGI